MRDFKAYERFVKSHKRSGGAKEEFSFNFLIVCRIFFYIY
jgi:hypothetical protein